LADAFTRWTDPWRSAAIIPFAATIHLATWTDPFAARILFVYGLEYFQVVLFCVCFSTHLRILQLP
jgi:hypothetical protein